MQTKKRAKPVKFEGKKEVKEKIENEVEAKEQAEDIQQENSRLHGHTVETHITSTTETIDIIEPLDDIPLELQEKPQEPVEEKDNEDETPVEEKETAEKLEGLENVPDPALESDVESEEDEVGKDDGDESEVKADESSTDEIEPPVIEQDGAFFNRPPDEYDKKKSQFPYFVKIFIITFLVGLAFFAGIYYAVSNKVIKFPGTEKKEAVVTEAPTPTVEVVDLSAYAIKVLNGTSISGVAGKLKTSLSEAGYKVDGTGNADNANFEKTEIAAKKTVSKAYLVKLKEFLGKTYAVGSVTDLTLGTEDVIVTIGSATAK